MVRRVIVVGASSGIGEAVVRRLCAAGDHVVAIARREVELRALVDSVTRERAGRADSLVHDVTHTASVSGVFEDALRLLGGGVDVLIYNAGVMPEPPAQGHDNAMDRHVFEVNVIGAVAWINEAATWFSRTGVGVIVGVGSVAGERGRSGFPAYNASKAALHTFLEAQRNRLARHGVRVVTIKPGPVQTAMLRGRQVPLTVKPEAVAAVIADSIESGALVRYVHWVWGPIMQVIRNIPSFVFRRYGPP